MSSLPPTRHDDLLEAVLHEWGTDQMAADQQRRHVVTFAGAPGKVLEIGCGRGAMLEMLKEAGIEAYGIDTSPTALSICGEKGLAVHDADALGHLALLEDDSLGGVFCAHLIEHMQPPDAARLITECFRTLKTGGHLLIVTPNARDLRIVERFWLDPTHVRPYPQKLLCALLKKVGFAQTTVSEDPEPAGGLLKRAAKLFLRIWFMGFLFRGDLVVCARKGVGP